MAPLFFLIKIFFYFSPALSDPHAPWLIPRLILELMII